jgi:hypothetical protein
MILAQAPLNAVMTIAIADASSPAVCVNFTLFLFAAMIKAIADASSTVVIYDLVSVFMPPMGFQINLIALEALV